ncbi:MAG: phosphatidylglycerophosphatase A [Blastocatellia bacterium]|nr:MAG: phosphatidylglycerophosphatase A [Blastocatellia bacterium]
MTRFFALPLATAAGVGYVRFAPGTCGSAVGLAIWALLPTSPAVHATTIVALFLAGTWSGSIAERHFGCRDPSQVVIDEVVGMLITIFLNPVGWAGAAGGFLLFRLADIIKPYPANRFERLPGGMGVMADDAVAAVYANLLLRAGLTLSHRFLS